MLGWTLYGGVRTSDQSDKQFLLNTGQEEFERLCSGDVLGVTDPVDMSSFEHEEFNKQLIQNQDGFYETRLPWKVGHVPLPENKNQSTARLYSVNTDSNEKEEERTYAKTVVGNPKTNQTKILGIPWDKSNGCMTVSFEPCLNIKSPITKRKMVAAINSVFDVLGWSSPVLIIMRVMFSNVCLLKLHWDEILPRILYNHGGAGSMDCDDKVSSLFLEA